MSDSLVHDSLVYNYLVYDYLVYNWSFLRLPLSKTSGDFRPKDKDFVSSTNFSQPVVLLY